MPNYQEIHYLGRVIDREKQAPISGAKISIHLLGSSRVVYSDLEGIYNFEVPFGDHSVREGEITIEAKGYKTYRSFIRLLPDDTDIGDIRLVDSHDQEAESSENLITIIATIVIVLALIVAALNLPTPQETPPLETPDNRINLQKPFHLSSKLVLKFLHSSVFSKKHAHEIASLFEE
ncbi:carboxypeptidase-like regulatory domain-containing protein [Brasilonema sp. UFV-L1]|uniref:carboxypeptidase-like regulatory domain-containing protein n=1 Tax=Brasilonema sp. UFV-L1 TaxID=2234130 RepID=UPI00145C9C5E|nr:carboxypeptidase-like regulatory domain-containing protein [Brasilonema sp. UFV-L1]NMG05893.1 hypothetical protein [Brasilonema sp. UFV-L1]